MSSNVAMCTPRGHQHYYPRCLTADELRAYHDAGRRMFEEIGLPRD